MKKLILFFVLVLILGCSKDDEGTSSNKDPLIGIWTGVTYNDYTFEYNIRDNGTFTSGFINVDIDDGGDGTWINTATELNFTNRSQTYLMGPIGENGETGEYTIFFNSEFSSFTFLGGVEFVRK